MKKTLTAITLSLLAFSAANAHGDHGHSHQHNSASAQTTGYETLLFRYRNTDLKLNIKADAKARQLVNSIHNTYFFNPQNNQEEIDRKDMRELYRGFDIVTNISPTLLFSSRVSKDVTLSADFFFSSYGRYAGINRIQDWRVDYDRPETERNIVFINKYNYSNDQPAIVNSPLNFRYTKYRLGVKFDRYGAFYYSNNSDSVIDNDVQAEDVYLRHYFWKPNDFLWRDQNFHIVAPSAIHYYSPTLTFGKKNEHEVDLKLGHNVMLTDGSRDRVLSFQARYSNLELPVLRDGQIVFNFAKAIEHQRVDFDSLSRKRSARFMELYYTGKIYDTKITIDLARQIYTQYNRNPRRKDTGTSSVTNGVTVKLEHQFMPYLILKGTFAYNRTHGLNKHIDLETPILSESDIAYRSVYEVGTRKRVELTYSTGDIKIDDSVSMSADLKGVLFSNKSTFYYGHRSEDYKMLNRNLEASVTFKLN